MSSVGFLGLGGNAMAVGLHQIDLHSAAKMDDTIAVMRLLKEGFNVDKRDPYGYTPLHWACQKGHTHTVQALLAAGANVHVRDKWRRTPLHRAAKEGHKQVVAALIDSGAEINAQGDNNWTPLHCSSFHGKLEIVEMLLRNGADQGAKDVRGRTSAAVCDMGLYDVEQSVKARILQLLETTPAQTKLQLDAPPRSAPMLVLPPSDTVITPAAVPAASETTRALPASSAGTDTPAAAAAASAAASASAAAASCSGAKNAGWIRQSGDSNSAHNAAVASAASAAVAEQTGVFALWDTSLSTGNSGSGPGGVIDAELADSEDVAWQEMWAMLHVPDPDDPDNNLYSEVKTLRKDVKRLRSDLNDTANETSSYEGILSVGSPAAGANSRGDANDSAGSTSSTSFKPHVQEEAVKRSAEWTLTEGDDVAKLPIKMPPGKRQKSEESDISRVDGEAETTTISNGMAFLATPSGSGGDAAGGGGGGGKDKGDIAQMGESELREQLAAQSRLVTEMMAEIALLKKHAGGNGYGPLDAPTGTVSALPVLEDRSFANKVR